MSVARDTVERRKAMPLASGVLDYFPDALLVVAEVSRIGNEQHHPGQPLHWDKSKSTDEADALMRHLIDRGTLDTDGVRHTAKVAWRALALLQRELDAEDQTTVAERERIMRDHDEGSDMDLFAIPDHRGEYGVSTTVTYGCTCPFGNAGLHLLHCGLWTP